MHHTSIRQNIIDRVIARRGRLHLFDEFAPAETALIVIDMQATFVAQGGPAEVPAARGIVATINTLADELRTAGCLICWVTHANIPVGPGSDWDGFFDVFVADDVRARTIASLSPGSADTEVWPALHVEAGDVKLIKNRYSALISGASRLERTLRSRGIRNVLIAGTKTNVCCEATARDAMMLDFRTAIVSDATAALSDDEHRASLETFIQNFGDVLTHTEAIALVRRRHNAAG